MTKQKVRMKYAWFPSHKGQIWENWGRGTERKCAQHLNANFMGWRAYGLIVQRCKIVPIKRKVQK